jgi:hypothetical protein
MGAEKNWGSFIVAKAPIYQPRTRVARLVDFPTKNPNFGQFWKAFE